MKKLSTNFVCLLSVSLSIVACGIDSESRNDDSNARVDRETPSENRCNSGSFDHDGDASTDCRPWTVCRTGETESAAGTSTSDRRCIVHNWPVQFGSSKSDSANEIGVDSNGNIYVMGNTSGNLARTHAGEQDAFVKKLDSLGNEIWTKQFGSNKDDGAFGLSVDSDGNSYVVGETYGDLGGENAGEADAYVTKLDSSGNEIWMAQFGTSESDAAYAVSIDSDGNSYVVGKTYGDLGGENAGDRDAFVTKLDSSGTRLWTHQFGTPKGDIANDISIDSDGNSYVTGNTKGDLGGMNEEGWDAFVTKLDSSGNQLWMSQFGDFTRGLSVDSDGNSYVVGETKGDLGGKNEGNVDAYVTKLDSLGKEVWAKQFGTSDNDYPSDISIDSSGNVYVTGNTYRELGSDYVGEADAYVTNLDSSGKELWTTQFGTSLFGGAYGISVDSKSNSYVVGWAYSGFGVPNIDAVVAVLNSSGELY